MFEAFLLRDQVEFIKADLNANFADSIHKKFHLIFSVEVIEHLENYTNFLRNAASLLEDDGLLIITTPNIENIMGRIKFALQGDFRFFGANYPEHITPIQTALFERQLGKAGLRLVHRGYYPEDGSVLCSRPSFRLAGTLLAKVLSKIMPKVRKGESHVFYLQKT